MKTKIEYTINEKIEFYYGRLDAARKCKEHFNYLVDREIAYLRSTLDSLEKEKEEKTETKEKP